MKSFNKLIFPCLLIAHIIIRFGFGESQVLVAESPEQLICSFQEQLHGQDHLNATDAVLAIRD